MREIKFRAWDKDMKGMLYGNDFYYLAMCFDKGIDYLFNHSKFKVMQFTGLKDSKGVDIYDGDIVKFMNKYYTTLSKDDILEVTWEDDDSRVCLYKKEGIHRYHYFGFNEVNPKDVKVIGNICENKELLKS